MRVVFLHGLEQRGDSWDETLKLLSEADIDSLDLLSIGGGDPTYTEMLEGLEKMYEREDEPLILCGISLGGILALDYAIRHPGRVRSLVLIGARYRMPSLLLSIQNLVFRLMPKRSFESIGISKMNLIRLTSSMKRMNLRDGMEKVSCPVILMCGEKDRWNLRASRKMNRILPSSCLHIVEGAGHELNEECPEYIAAAVNHLLSK